MMSRSVMDLKDVCLELCAGGILIKALELVRLPNYQSLNPVEFLYECLTSEAARRQTRKVATRIKNQHASTRTRVLRILCTRLTAI